MAFSKKTASKAIQSLIGFHRNYNKATVHDLNNPKYLSIKDNNLTWYKVPHSKGTTLVALIETYGTNNLKIPLISAYGVSHVGRTKLKTFPLCFVWVLEEKGGVYCWFLEKLNEIINGISAKTTFATDKRTAMTNQLDKQFRSNEKLFCR
ncbi:hypothetical protein CU098_011220 [Rhizopus stolonifer]|uniref:MULE transposase domain-containing protein n=1 Tax=Rhizopus stolonifer TaxID=4846 RepID=A0A367KE94_RHIST|nr:hypothetical protein CU098_011220 [Rhizopus stolonifer]